MVEVDGPSHRCRTRQGWRRSQIVHEFGVKLIRLNSEVAMNNIEQLVALVRHFIPMRRQRTVLG